MLLARRRRRRPACRYSACRRHHLTAARRHGPPGCLAVPCHEGHVWRGAGPHLLHDQLTRYRSISIRGYTRVHLACTEQHTCGAPVHAMVVARRDEPPASSGLCPLLLSSVLTQYHCCHGDAGNRCFFFLCKFVLVLARTPLEHRFFGRRLSFTLRISGTCMHGFAWTAYVGASNKYYTVWSNNSRRETSATITNSQPLLQ